MTQKKTRCRRDRSEPNHFCPYHQKESSRFLLDELVPWLRKERDKACQTSHATRPLDSETIISQRLERQGMLAVRTVDDGNCFFAALQQTMSLTITPFDLRLKICDYMSRNSATFVSCFQGNQEFEYHVASMRSHGAWATGYEVAAASHMFCCPIRLVTDAREDTNSIIEVAPPAMIHREAWARPVYLTHYLK